MTEKKTFSGKSWEEDRNQKVFLYVNSITELCINTKLYSWVLYCIVLYCIVLYCIVLFCFVLFCIVLYVYTNVHIKGCT